MTLRTTRLPAMSLLVCLSLGIGARADLMISTPSGLNPGDQFRIVFVTDASTTATSSDISTYNSFVNTQATNEAGNVTYNGVTLTWYAIASTNSTSAIANIGENTSTDIPIYLSTGVLVTGSDNANGLWSGSINTMIDLDLNGHDARTGVGAWTGTTTSGNADTLAYLGAPGNDEFGAESATDNEWVALGQEDPHEKKQLYGISQTLTVPGGVSATPEPSTLALATIGAACASIGGLIRKHRSQQRRGVDVQT